ncbi:hypothetical protein F2Q70_00024769 [Brassica cretica]|uniref:DUF4005 domain-containing protein n=1 Tax=Brassica cretica TaxID=69181 RepID=A0A8S9LHM0_BRACR|nr:hypothetical protein F2Q70_00024769 [Brassica cretica]
MHLRNKSEGERASESHNYKIPPSTERTIIAREPYRGAIHRDSRRRDDSFNSYRSREYRRYEQHENSVSHINSQPARSLWVEKQNQRDRQATYLEKSESSRPTVQPIQNAQAPFPPTDIPPGAINIAREKIRDYMQQHSNCQDPTENATHKERLRQSEEHVDIEEAATRLAQSNLVTNHLEPEQVPNEETPERIPASHRLDLLTKHILLSIDWDL